MVLAGWGAGGPALPTAAQAEHDHLWSTSAEQLQRKNTNGFPVAMYGTIIFKL